MIKLERLTESAIEPTYATQGSAAFDIHADIKGRVVNIHGRLLDQLCHCLRGEFTIKPNQRAIIPTGWCFDIESGWQMNITPRSGNAAKHGITITNSPAVIDSDYKGETFVIIQNDGSGDFVIRHGDRIAQAQMNPVHRAPGIGVRDVERSGGLGSTGA